MVSLADLKVGFTMFKGLVLLKMRPSRLTRYAHTHTVKPDHACIRIIYCMQKFREMSSRLEFLPHNTHCTLRAAATTEDFAAINTEGCTTCFCVDPDNIEYTAAPVQCIVSGTYFFFF